jgi:hypothetical protein
MKTFQVCKDSKILPSVSFLGLLENEAIEKWHLPCKAQDQEMGPLPNELRSMPE